MIHSKNNGREIGMELQTASGRDETYVRDICKGWRFGGENLSETKAANPDFDDSLWEEISIPHTWNLEDDKDIKRKFLRTSFWYRKQIFWDSFLAGKKIYLEFLGVNTKTEVFVNGEHIYYDKQAKEYPHQGGYTAFRFEITQYLNQGKNIIAVKVDNTKDEAIAPISGDFNMYGGIYRRVYLVAVDFVHIDLSNNGSSGLFITTPKVRSQEAPDTLGEVHLKADIVNDSDQEKTVDVLLELTGDHAPEAILEQITIPAGKRYSFNKNMKVEHPHLWNGISYSESETNHDIGYQYDITLTISEQGIILDKVSDKIGFRYFWVDKETGFYLNGKPHFLRGVNRHQCRKDFGNALTEAEHEKDMELLIDLGVNAVRLSHYPQTDYFYDLCDKNGIIVWTEIPFVNELGKSEEFASVTKRQLIELIRQQYNRPSICFWGLQNEVGNGTPTNDYITMKQLIYELDQIAKQEDPSGRYTTQAINQNDTMNQKKEASYYSDYSDNKGWKSDLIAWNIYPGWYDNFSGTFADIMEAKKIQDSRPMGVSEYGWGSNVNQHEANPKLHKNELEPWGKWHPEEYQSMMHETAVRYIGNNDYLWCALIWNMFDFAVDARNEGSQPKLNDKGLVTSDREIKKDSYYLYKANWNKRDKFVYITSRRWIKREQPSAKIKVYSNCDIVKVFRNDTMIGTMTDTGCGIFLMKDVALILGFNEIKVIGTKEGTDTEYIDTCIWERMV